MRDVDNSGLPVARIEPRDAADRMVIVRAEAARRAGQLGRAGVVVGKLAGFVGLMALLSMLGGSSRQHRYDIDIRLPNFEHRLDHKFDFNDPAYRKLMIDIAKLPKYDSQLRDPFERPVKLKPAKIEKPRKAKRQPRP
jgi:hypothetical protein